MPPLAEGESLARRNAGRLASREVRIGSRSLQEFRRWCRQSCLEQARDWTSRILGSDVDPPSDGLLFVTGHQPQLAHAGVWVKNMAVAELARRTGGTGLNLIVDNDTVSRQSVLLPAGSRAQPRLEAVPFDAAQSQQPWEELQLSDPGLFASFAGRVSELLSGWGISPVLNEIWPAAVEVAGRTGSTAASLSAARLYQERRWGMANLELPVSAMCRTEPFLEFAADLIRNHVEFHACYNQAVHAYRRAYHVRNDRHPVPDLERRGERFEIPFRYWQPGARNRKRVFVARGAAGGWELFAEADRLASVPADGDLLAALKAVQAKGRFRTRALTTTLFARLGLGDLFLHGIGGAKYDEITDRIIERFFGLDAPGYLTLSATLHLPLGAHAATEDDVRRLRGALRELRFNADRFLDECCAHSLLSEKRTLIAAQHSATSEGLSRRERRQRRPENRRRYLRFKQVEERLAELAAGRRQRTESELREAMQQVQANSILTSRDFAAVLFPEEQLNRLLDRVRQQMRETESPVAGGRG